MSDEIQITHRELNRHPLHPSITHMQIFYLVEIFYERVRENERLGPIFNDRLENGWDEHLTKMRAFWESVLLRTGAYKGKPLPAHIVLDDVVPNDFRIWLELFDRTAVECFTSEAAPLVIETAKRIAQSLWLAMFGTHDSKPPEWPVNSG